MNELIEVAPERRASCAMDVISRAQRDHDAKHRRPPALTAREALEALSFEALFVYVCAGNLRSGTELTDADFERLTLAVRRINGLAMEVNR